jgi:hypothetical protein
VKRKPQPKRLRKQPHRLIDDLIGSGRLDGAFLPLLEEVHLQLTEQWTQSETTLDNGQTRALLSLLGALFAPARSESAKTVQRAGNIALDHWYRVEWLGQTEKSAIKDLCCDWSLGPTAVREAKAVGRKHVGLLILAMVGNRPKGQRLPNVEGLLKNQRYTHRGRVRAK